MTATPVEVGEVAGGFDVLIGTRRRMVVAVSGGADSMALMHLLATWRASTSRTKPRLSVATVDHGLRADATAEAAFVASEAERLGLSHATLRWTGPHPATGIQAAAREARYRLLIDHAKELEADCLALAHTADDQAETFLMRLARGSGLEGLAAMRDECRRKDLALLRPLLDLPKSRLIATLRAGGHPWIEDPSNADDRFERVRIRKFLAAGADLGLKAEKIALSARRLVDAESSLRSLQTEPATVPAIEIATALYAETPVARLGRTRFLMVRTLRQLIRWYGGAAGEPELAQLEQLARQLQDDKARQQCRGLTLGGCKIELLGDSHERIRVYREGAGANIPPASLEPAQSLEWDGGRFRIEVGSAEPGARVEAIGMARWASLKRDVPELEALRWPAAAAATLPLVLRGASIVAVPALPRLLRAFAPSQERLRTAWNASAAFFEPGFGARFRDPPAW